MQAGRLCSLGRLCCRKQLLQQCSSRCRSLAGRTGSRARQVQERPSCSEGIRRQLWSVHSPSPLQKAAAVAAERVEVQDQAETPPIVLDSRSERKVLGKQATGAFQRLPIVPSAEEHIRSALKRANRVTGNKAIKNRAQHARNLSARKLDAFTKELASPLSRVVKNFPSCGQIHPFERALLDLTLGVDSYERRLVKLDALRKSCLEVGKSFAGQAGKAASMKDAFAVLDEGFASLEAVFRKNAASLDAVKDVARMLRKLPAVDTAVPTVALVGAPNVGKSSLVQVLSSGLPEVCNYPFTTRTVKMGHFFVDSVPHQVTDTPGLLNRAEEDRNVMERLTIACLEHLPTAVLFVVDLTGEAGTSLRNQLLIQRSLRARFPLKPWVDVFSKADLLGEAFADADSRSSLTVEQVADLVADQSAVITASDFVRALPCALRISSVAETGIDELKQTVLDMLAATKMMHDP